VRAAEVRALFELLDIEFSTAEEFRERLRAIVAPVRGPLGVQGGGGGEAIPRLD
jgi:hypothetical protein